ncbi:CHAT domain-containing protein [Embleya sp. NBC_00896]|uniref:CHAT domain-containing protein n=1 Tax=Embleya sp. NBC_00896 TaxID=2975961 RepID=UPI003866A5A5|nr:CHAT domain-containing protein [Embleya sp. NBC_00896]
MLSDRIISWADAQEKDVVDLILCYDVDFDVPMRHRYAIGVLRIVEAFGPRWPMPVRVGAYWCELVRADVEYDLLEGLRIIDASRAEAEQLGEECMAGSVQPGNEFKPYVAARWSDGTGRILYRLGSFARARIAFESAGNIARKHNLWWCLPDIDSNFIRAQFEEQKQTYGATFAEKGSAKLVMEMERIRSRAAEEIEERPISPVEDVEDLAVREKEFLRGYSSILHNLAISYREQGKTGDSLKASRESLEISERLGDFYRIGQSLNHQARCQPDKAIELYEKLEKGKWRRGHIIARQNLAKLRGGIGGVKMLRDLLEELGVGSRGGKSAGFDIDLQSFTVRFFEELVKDLGDSLGRSDPCYYSSLVDEAIRRRFEMARSIRRVVATPAYKRAYAVAVRPNFLERVADLLTDGDTPGRNTTEQAFALAEESSARELLDLLSSMNLPQLGRPSPPAVAPQPQDTSKAGGARPPTKLEAGITRSRQRHLRRAGLRAATPEIVEALRETLAARETEFEKQFLHQPLESAPHDPEISLRVRMFAVNNPGTCVVRYFSYGPGKATHLGAFVFRGGALSCVKGIPYEEIEALIRDLDINLPPTKHESEHLWSLLIAPIWEMANAGGNLTHLVIIPVDELFSLPLHIASPPGANTLPLAAMVPLSQSVSATAFVGRSRHLLKRQPVEPDDNLAAIIVADEETATSDPDEDGVPAIGDEVVDSGWPAEQIVIAGDRPHRLKEPVQVFKADWDGVAVINESKPEFFLYAGHGQYHKSFGQLGPSLILGGDELLTQYDVALRLRLPRNKLTIVGACLAGQSAQTGGGDVVGFLRAFVAAGAGAVGIPLWSVLNTAMVDTVRTLLAASRAELATPERTFDVVQVLHEKYREVAQRHTKDFKGMVENMPLSLYL